MAITFTQEEKNYIVNKLQTYALRRKFDKVSLTLGGIIDNVINNLPEPELKAPWYKRLWRL